MPTFIDIFAGCGGLSLGLINAGFTGLFAVEKNKEAFETLIHNLSYKKIKNGFTWVDWLPYSHMTTSELIKNYKSNLLALQGSVDLIAGGPPCQGFSFAGLRNAHDPRNRLTEEYIEIVSYIKPKMLLLENVKGFQSPFKNATNILKNPYADYVEQKLSSSSLNYKIFRDIMLSSSFGVPQQRPRFVMIAIRNDILDSLPDAPNSNEDFFCLLKKIIISYKKEHQLNEITTVGDAISDLELAKSKLKPCVDSINFQQISYEEPKKLSSYVKLLRKNCLKDCEPNSLRIPRHKKETLNKFNYILQNAEKGKTLSKEIRLNLKIKKQCLTPLAKNLLSTTITTAPDDCLHYSEARILTVRENARLQSFPDWFEFKGKYTSGGLRRREECPRYTQVGNAVPPIMAEILGLFLLKFIVGDNNG